MEPIGARQPRLAPIDLAFSGMPMKQFVVRCGKVWPRLDPSQTLENLRDLLVGHCSPSHFEEAVSIMGRDPYSVASYLCVHDHVFAQDDGRTLR